MDEILAGMQRLIPDVIERMQRRFKVLEMIFHHQPIGRRSLSELTHLTERVLRTEIDSLKAEQLILVQPKGMLVTQQGEDLINQLSSYFRYHSGLRTLGTQLEVKYGIAKVIVAPSDEPEQLGLQAARYLESIVRPDDTVTVTGGKTMKRVAEHLKPLDFSIHFTPARGGLGEKMPEQANMIAAQMAEHAGGTYDVLYVPDDISESTYVHLMSEPAVTKVLERMKSADIMINGIGNALKMAQKRHASLEQIEKLKSAGAIGEAFGYYFDKAGKSVYKVRTIGLSYDDIAVKSHIIAVAGGSDKTEAIRAYLKFTPKQTVLITDDAVARKLLQGDSP